jgi:hypothetical protein
MNIKMAPLRFLRYWGSHVLSVFIFSSAHQHPDSVLPVTLFGSDRSSASFVRPSCLRVEKRIFQIIGYSHQSDLELHN